jgi:hypothetical protein
LTLKIIIPEIPSVEVGKKMQVTALLTEGAFTLGVRDSSVESLNIMLVI